MENDMTVAFGWMLRAMYPEKFINKKDADEAIHTLFDQKLLQEFLDYNPPIAKQGDRWDLYLEFERQRIHRNIDAWIASERVNYWIDLWRDTGVLIYEKQPPVQQKYIIVIDPYQA